MTFLLLAYLPLIFSLLTTGILTFLSRPITAAKIGFGGVLLGCAGWATFTFLSDIRVFSENTMLILTRFGNLFGAMAPTFFFFFALSFPRNINFLRWLLPWLIVETAIVMFIVTIPSISTVSVDFSTVPPEYGDGIGDVIYFIHLLLGFALGFVVLGKQFARGNLREKLQLKYVFFAVGLAVLLNIVISEGVELVYGWPAAIELAIALPPITVAAWIVFYAMVRHQLFDVTLIGIRAFTYLLTVLSLGMIGGAGLILVASNAFELERTTEESLVIVLAVVVGILVRPFFRGFRSLTTSLFNKDAYKTRRVLDELSTAIISHVELERISKTSLNTLAGVLKPIGASLIVFSDDKIYRQYDVGSPLPRSKKLTADTNVSDLSPHLHVEELIVEGRRIGLLIFQAKRNGTTYTRQDKELLALSARSLSLAVENARYYEQIAEFNRTLEARVRQATRRLAKSNERLQQLDQAKDEFIKIASHQLRTPLSVIKNYMALLKARQFGKLTTQQAQAVTRSYQSIQRMVRLIEELFDVSRISSGQFTLDTAPTGMDQLLKSELEQFSSVLESSGIKVRTNISATEKPLIVDAGKIREVIANFLDNAIQYSPDNLRIDISLEQTSRTTKFTVTDNGIGIPKAEQSQLFTKFYRASNARSLQPSGSGLGLYVARKIVEKHGGKIIFKSSPSKGSTFGFSLPNKV